VIHLIVRLPVPYQRTLCRTLHDCYDGAFVAWFADRTTVDVPCEPDTKERFAHHYLSEVGYGKLFRALRADSEAVVILGGWSSPMTNSTLLLTSILRIPVFIWADHPHPRKRSWLKQRLRKLYLRFLSVIVNGFLACGRPTVEHLESLGIASQKITNFPYWVDVPKEWSMPRRCEEFQEGQPLRLIAVGRHNPVKGFEVAIEAVALANRKAGRNIATLDLIGDGAERPHLEALARSLGLQDVVTFSGWLNSEQVWRRLRTADALVVTSRFEGYGAVVLEALANARPVLASNQVTAALDRDDGLGAIFFHAPGDSDCLARQIKILAEDENVLRMSSEVARAIAEKWRPERAASILNNLLGSSIPCHSCALKNAGSVSPQQSKRASA
jgi:glycosyltransferase involved in cell wall biosynthesis